MSTKHEHEDWNQNTMENGRSQTHGRRRQLDEGTYCVSNCSEGGDTIVGMVFVEGTGDTFACTEHWVLSSQYQPPRPGCGLKVEATDEKYPSRTAFFDAMRTRAQEWGDYTYIEAVCQPSNKVPA